MKQILFYIFIFSFSFSGVYAQDDAELDREEEKLKRDSIKNQIGYKHQQTFSFGVDFVKPIKYIANNDNKGFEVTADYRLNNNLYIATEIGSANVYTEDPHLSYISDGNYFKIGVNYNVAKSAKTTNNALYIGARFVGSFYKQTVTDYNIGQDYWPGTSNGSLAEQKSSTYSLEFLIGVKYEVVKNIIIGWSARTAYPVAGKKPENFDNLYIPGLGYDNKSIINFNYTISYLIPITKKK